MNSKYQKQFEEKLENLKKLVGRDLTKEEIEQARLEFENPVITDIEFRKGEADLTKLSQGRFNHLLDRNLRDLNARVNYLLGTMSDLYMLIGAIAKKIGIDDPIKASQEFGESIEIKK